MFNFNRKSLQAKIVLLNGLTILMIGMFVFWEVKLFSEEKEKVVLGLMESFAKTANESIQAQFFERYGDVQAFAMNPKIQSRSKSEIVEALDGYVALYGIYDLIIIADLNGKIVGVNSKDPTGKPINAEVLYGRSVANATWFKNTVAGNFTEDKQKGFVGTYVEEVQTDPYVSEVYGEPRPGSAFSALIKDKQGAPIGVVTNRAGSRWFEAELATLSETAYSQGLSRPILSLIDARGVVRAEVERQADGKINVLRDPAILGATNLVNGGLGSAISVTQTRASGSGYSMNKSRGLEMIEGYSPVKGKKWVDEIAWSVIVQNSKADALATVNEFFWKICAVFGLVMATAIAAALFFSRSLAKTMRTITLGLSNGSMEVIDVSKKLAESSNILSASAAEQAAALQETVASIDEVSAMVAKNADNAKRSQEISTGSAESAQKGKSAVTDVIRSIDEINVSNQEIVGQIEEGNRQISEIVKVITEIGTKTKVINDIVFQTKLLSFNASVEAARAGEHGKGFAVVAEEVGNLAQMSGNAAKEISQMLESSISKVDQIVNETKLRVERLTTMSKEKVAAGTVTARRCGEVLEEIVRSVGEVNVMVSEIATASKEQAQGVSEINKAMNQLDQVTQANAASSQDAAENAAKLRDQSGRMSVIIGHLRHAVEGQASSVVDSFQQNVERSIEPVRSGNVMEFPRKSASAQPAFKAAVGAENPPSREDSRFEEV